MALTLTSKPPSVDYLAGRRKVMCTTCPVGRIRSMPNVRSADAVEDAFARAKRDRHDVKAKLVDRAQRQVLVEGGGAACDRQPPIPAARSACARADSGPSV